MSLKPGFDDTISRRVDETGKFHHGGALRAGFESLKDRPLCTSTAVEICPTLKGAALDIRGTPGTQPQLVNDKTGEVIYTPPEGQQRLRDFLADWERFLHNTTDMDPLVRLAVGHYQFEAVHPFTDGNGRTGRILNILFLVQAGPLNLPIPAAWRSGPGRHGTLNEKAANPAAAFKSDPPRI
jgi:Fic family protein